MFDNDRVVMAALIELEHPAATIRLCDGAFLNWPGVGLFVSEDPTYGAVGDFTAAAESVGDDAPACTLTLQVPSLSATVALADPTAQGSAARLWVAEVDPESGTIVGTPELQFLGFYDSIEVSFGRETQSAKAEMVSAAEKLFFVAEGNVLSDRFHQSAWPGETGFALCTGSEVQVPWGVAGSFGSSGFFGGVWAVMQQR